MTHQKCIKLRISCFIAYLLMLSSFSVSFAQKDTVRYSINTSYLIFDNFYNSYLFPNFIVGYRKHSLFAGPALTYYPLFQFALKDQYALHGGYRYLLLSKDKIQLSGEAAIFYSKLEHEFYVTPNKYGSNHPNLHQSGRRTYKSLGFLPGFNFAWKLKYNIFLSHSANMGFSRYKSFWNYHNPDIEDGLSRAWNLDFLMKFGIGYNF